MKRKRATKKLKLEPLSKKTLQNTSQLAENHVTNDKTKEPENVTSVHMETEIPRTSTSTTFKRDKQADLEMEKTDFGSIKSYPKALSDLIVTVIKEISKEAGGLANLTKSLVDNSINNEQIEKPHADMDLEVNESQHEETESQHHQNPEYKQEELNAALTVIKKTMKLDAADPFNRPVDPVELGIPDYFDVIDTPMDFGTICNNLENGLKYMNSADVYKDVEYIWHNCVKYNKKGDYILDLMKRVKSTFMKYWKTAGLQTVQSPPIVESSILKEKDHPLPLPANNSTQPPQKEAGPIQVAEIEPSPINMQAGQSQSQSQSQGQSQTPQSPSEQDDEDEYDDLNLYTPDSRSIQKKGGFRGPTRCVEILNMVQKRVKIITNELGQPVGPEACKLTSFLGVIARDGNLAPLTYATWIKMPEEYKENMWQKVLTRYDIDPSCRSWVLMSLRTKWRNFKSRLKATYYDVHETDEERLKDCDERVLPDQWAVLVKLWSSEKWQNICATNKANRSKLKFSHTTGKKSFARIREEERAKRPDGQEPSQAELFILTRTRKNGQPVNEATAAVISQLCESTTNNEETPDNKNKIQDDVYKRVMGQDTKGGVSLYGLCETPSVNGTVGPTRVEALKMVEEKNKEVVEMKERLALVEQTCSQMAAQMSHMVSMMATMHKGTLGRNVPNSVDGNLAIVDNNIPNISEPPKSTSNYEVPPKKTRGRPKKR